MTTFHDPQPQSRRAARQSERERERERASKEAPEHESFTAFPPAGVVGQPQPEESHGDEGDSGGEGVASSTSSPDQPPMATGNAYLTAPPPNPHAESSYSPPNTPQQASSAQQAPQVRQTSPEQQAPSALFPAAGSATTSGAIPASEEFPERTLTRRQLREMRARQEAAAPIATPAAAAPTEPSTSPPPGSNPNADAVPQYRYSDSRGNASDSRPETDSATANPKSDDSLLSLAPEVQGYVEPPALVDPLAVAPEAAVGTNAPDSALTAFEALLTNSSSVNNTAEETEAPLSPLLARGDESASQTSNETPQQKLFNFGSNTETGQPASSENAGPENPPITLSDARAEFDEFARKRLDGELPPAATPPTVSTKDPLSVAAPPTAKATPLPAPVQNVPQPSEPAMPSSTDRWSQPSTTSDDADEAVVSRTIGSGTSASNALVLPAIPFATDIRGPLDSSGETLLTGSIDLPSTLSASGVSERFDHDDIDSLLDLNDNDMVSTDSAPVRAVKAVSTFSNQAVTQTQKPKGTRALTVLMISATSMAVVVGGLLVAVFVFNML